MLFTKEKITCYTIYQTDINNILMCTFLTSAAKLTHGGVLHAIWLIF
jgi:hypothetical protein